MPKTIKHTGDIDQLVSPSWLSGLFVVVASLIIVLGSIGLLYYHSSNLHLLHVPNDSHQATVTDNYQTIDDRFSPDVILSDIPLFIFWGGVGIAAYALTMSLVTALHSAAEVHEELDYVNSNRQQLLRFAGERFAIRLSALVAWFIYLRYTQHVLMPYAVALGFAGTTIGGWFQGAGYVLGAIGISVFVLHIHVVLVRLIALKPRLFG